MFTIQKIGDETRVLAVSYLELVYEGETIMHSRAHILLF